MNIVNTTTETPYVRTEISYDEMIKEEGIYTPYPERYMNERMVVVRGEHKHVVLYIRNNKLELANENWERFSFIKTDLTMEIGFIKEPK